MIHLVHPIRSTCIRMMITTPTIKINRTNMVRCYSYLHHMPTPSINATETLRKSLVYKSKQRGLLELDIVVGSFAEQHLAKMDEIQLKEYEHIINLEGPTLWRYLQDDIKTIPTSISSLSIFHAMKTHMSSIAWEKQVQQQQTTIQQQLHKKHSQIDNTEVLRKSLLQRSKQCGLRELDLVIGSFADKYIHQMNVEQLREYAFLLSLESPHLWSYLQDPKVHIPSDIKSLPLFGAIKQYMMSMSFNKNKTNLNVYTSTSTQQEDTEILRKSLLWRSKQRGILELDLLVGSFADKYVRNMALPQLREYQRLIALESPDLLKYLQDPSATIPDEIAYMPMFHSLKQHMTNAHQTFEKIVLTAQGAQGNQ